MASKKTEEIRSVNGKTVTLTNLNKVFWPKEKYTKGDLINYYTSVAKYIMPYLKDRPESLNRHPNGITGQNFFQKNVAQMPPDWVTTQEIFSESNGTNIRYLICQNEATLIYLANLGCIEINPWFSTIKHLDKPDYLAIDLDPEGVTFDAVIECALAVKEVLERAGAPGFPKTSGATGIHIYVPLKGKYDYEISKEFAHVIAQITNEMLPDTTSIERSPSKRQHRIYVDFLQNRKGQTLAAPYSVRPKPMATVSTPLKWKELKKGLTPENFTIKNMLKRIERLGGDIFGGVFGTGVDIKKCLKNLGA